MRPQGLKPAGILVLYAALKRRSSTAPHEPLFPLLKRRLKHRSGEKLLLREQSFGGAHVVVTVVDTNHDYVLGRSCAIFRGFGSGFEIVGLGFCVGELADGFDVLPISGIDGIFGAFNGRKTIDRAEGNVNLAAVKSGGEIFDTRRGSVNLEAAALFRRGQGFTRGVRGRIGGDDFHGVAAVR